MHQLTSTMDRARPAAPIILRVLLGVLFVMHGIDKFDAGISMIDEMFRSWGVPAPGFTAPLAALIEIVGGAMLVLGIGTRLAATVLSAVMVSAVMYVKMDVGIISSQPMPGAELDLALLAGLLTLVVIGPGRFSLDAVLGIERGSTSPDRQPGLV